MQVDDLQPLSRAAIGRVERDELVGELRLLERSALELFTESARLEINQPGRTPGVKINPSLAFLKVVEEWKVRLADVAQPTALRFYGSDRDAGAITIRLPAGTGRPASSSASRAIRTMVKAGG